MTKETVEVEYDEVVTKTERSEITLCDGCGVEIEPGEGFRFYSDRKSIDALDFCKGCFPSGQMDITTSSRGQVEIESETLLKPKQILAGVCVGIFIGILVF